MASLNLDTIGVANAYDIMPRAMSGMNGQDETSASVNDVKKNDRAVQRIRDHAPKTISDPFYKGKCEYASPTFTSMQTSGKSITNKVREVFCQRPKNVNISGISYFISKTEFSGEVRLVDVERRFFVADVSNVNHDKRYSAKFDMDEVPSADVSLVRPGALFYWLVGRENTNGTERNISQIHFRRMASIGKKQIRKIEDNARKEAEVIRSFIVEV